MRPPSEPSPCDLCCNKLCTSAPVFLAGAADEKDNVPHVTAAGITWANLHYHILGKWLCGRGYLLEHVFVCTCRVSDLGMFEISQLPEHPIGPGLTSEEVLSKYTLGADCDAPCLDLLTSAVLQPWPFAGPDMLMCTTLWAASRAKEQSAGSSFNTLYLNTCDHCIWDKEITHLRQDGAPGSSARDLVHCSVASAQAIHASASERFYLTQWDTVHCLQYPRGLREGPPIAGGCQRLRELRAGQP